MDNGKQVHGVSLTPLELEVLAACREATLHNHELVPLLAEHLGVSVSEVWYTWAHRRCRQLGTLPGTDWKYFFHGEECDLKNTADGRFLRVDFGPGGILETFTAWGVLQLIMTSAAPWPEHRQAQAHFAKEGPPYGPESGDLFKICATWDRLESVGAFQPAAPQLVEFQKRHTTIRSDGIAYVEYPPGTSNEMSVDCSVAHRSCLSSLGQEVLEELVATQRS
jgi:hypothetical protein